MQTWREIWTRQRTFQQQVYPNWSNFTEQERASVTRDFALHMVSEVGELLRETEWKVHRTKSTERRSRLNMLEELVDILKFWAAMALLHGFEPEDILEEFDRKSEVVEQRWRHERAITLDPAKMVVVDVDNTLAAYTDGFLAFVEQETGLTVDPKAIRTTDLYAELAQISGLSFPKIADLKHKFRESGAKLHLPVMPGARNLLVSIRLKGGQIVLLTKRPYDQYKRMLADTIVWMRQHRLPYDVIWMAEDKREFLLRTAPQVSMIVNDEPAECVRLARAGYNVKMIAWPYNEMVPVDTTIEEDVHRRLQVVTLYQLTENIQTLGLPMPNLLRP